jgi:hypothetical protein
MSPNDRETLEDRLRANLQPRSDALRQLLESVSSHWGYEDPIYRFYHQSFKVYPLAESTRQIVTALQQLLPEQPLNPWFLQIVGEGTGKEFKIDDNQRWLEVTRPILEAFFHARYFLEMACRYAQAPEKEQPMPSGWAALLYLYNLR